jgi:hypothetical protein
MNELDEGVKHGITTKYIIRKSLTKKVVGI